LHGDGTLKKPKGNPIWVVLGRHPINSQATPISKLGAKAIEKYYHVG
jgi:hypothetical protein